MDTAEISPPPLLPAGPQRHALTLSWQKPAGLVGLSFANFFLQIITLGIYSFWGKTEVRKRLWSGIRLNGEPLQYTGTGKELFLGFIIVFFALLLPVLLGSVAVVLTFGPQSPAVAVYQMLLLPLFLFLTGLGLYRANRYRLSRTRWRGIRGALVGNSAGYGWTYFWTALLIPLTLGWIIPWRTTKLQSLITNDMKFGDRPFRFTAGTGPLYARFAVLWVGFLIIGGAYALFFAQYILPLMPPPPVEGEPAPTPPDPETIVLLLALIYGGLLVALLLYSLFSAWYRAAQFNHFARHTFYEGASFRGTTTALGFIWLGLSNFFIVILSLGILTPIAQARSTRYIIEHLAIDGTVPLDDIAQAAAQDIKRGEGLAEAFDIDAF